MLSARVADAMPALEQDEQRLAIALYRLLAEGQPVARERLAQEVGVAVEWANEILERWPGVYRDARGCVIGFWGLTQQRMPPHRFRVDGCELWTWCAWDSLFIPIVLAKRARVESLCAMTGDPVWAEVTPTGVDEVSPIGAMISFLRPQTEFSHDMIVSFCHHVLFFSSEAAGRAWTATRRNALLMTLEEGAEVGRLVVNAKFGQALAHEMA